jgi:hypothetical protein
VLLLVELQSNGHVDKEAVTQFRVPNPGRAAGGACLRNGEAYSAIVHSTNRQKEWYTRSP